MNNWKKVCKITELEEGKFSIFNISKLSIGLLKLGSNYYAMLNYCPHAGAELCKGELRKKTVHSTEHGVKYSPNETVLSCPWHGWEFNIENGTTDLIGNSRSARVFETKVEAGFVSVKI